jgi:hypothetical protein
MPAATRRAARAPRPPTRSRSRLIALLIVGPLLCVIALTSLAYVGLSQQAQRDTLAQVGVVAQAAHGALQANMGDVQLANGQMTGALPATVTTLNNNNAEAQRLRAQVGVNTLIAQREQNTFVVIASSLAPGQTGAAPGGLGERLGGAIAANGCGATQGATTGTLTIAGAGYLAGSVPLKDGAGACVGVVVALTPLSALQQTPLEYTVILAMAGALLSLLTVSVGLALHGRGNEAGGSLQAERLRAAVASLAEAEAACAAQMEQRDWVGRRLTVGRSHMQRLMTSLAGDRVALQDATSDIWAGVSHPGAPVDPATAMRLAREGAVVAARVGSRLNDFDAVTSALFADLTAADEVDTMLGEALAQTEATIAELRALTGAEPLADARATARGSAPHPAMDVSRRAIPSRRTTRRRSADAQARRPQSPQQVRQRSRHARPAATAPCAPILRSIARCSVSGARLDRRQRQGRASRGAALAARAPAAKAPAACIASRARQAPAVTTMPATRLSSRRVRHAQRPKPT